MHWPQITLICIWLLSFGIILERHGQPKKGKENFYIHFVAVFINVVLLYFGGFWG